MNVPEAVRSPVGRHPSPAVRTWRATTATRVFGLALGVGQTLNSDSLAQSLPMLVALTILAATSALLGLGRPMHSAWVPVAESLLASILLASLLPGGPLYVYLAVPAVVAGIAQGWVTAINASLAGMLGYYATSLTTAVLRVVPDDLETATVWLAVGLGGGLLAGWQSRSLREVETRQAPYAAAHRLVAQLSELTQAQGVGLDSVGVARELGLRVADVGAATKWAIYVTRAADGSDVLAAHEPLQSFSLLARRVPRRRGSWSGGTAVLALRVGDHAFGVGLFHRHSVWTDREVAELQQTCDELAIRLETALLFDQVRDAATSEERQRLARDIHDGVAQEVVALGYLVDEIEATTAEPDTLRMAANLRHEVARTVEELRHSIYDLRHKADGQPFSGVLAEYLRQVTAGSDLQLHLVLGEPGAPLPAHAESELLRIAQEAVGNVRKHARAENLWVTLTTNADGVILEVADDGVGQATPRERHYGMHTMRERADRIGADLAVHERPGGGTIVRLFSRTATRAHRPPASPQSRHPRTEVTA